MPAALATVYVVWGSTYLAIRVMVETIPPLLGAGVRFLVAGAVFWAILAARRGLPAMRVTRVEVAGAALVGVLLLFGGNGLVTIAERDVPSGLAALLVGSVPLWVVLLRGASRERVSPTTLAAVVLGFAGLALLLLPADRPDDAPLGPSLLVVLAAALWAVGSFASRSTRVSLPRDAFLSTSVQMLIGGAAMVAAGLAAGEAGDLHPSAISADSALAFAFLITIGSLLAFTAYVWLLQNAPISTVATYAYVNPVIAVFLGWAILSEEVTPLVIAAAAVIVASVAGVVREESRPAAPDPEGEAAIGRAPSAVLSDR